MITAHRGDGVTTYVYSQDAGRVAVNVLEVRQAVERIEMMCRDILTALNLLTDLLPAPAGNASEGGEMATEGGIDFDDAEYAIPGRLEAERHHPLTGPERAALAMARFDRQLAELRTEVEHLRDDVRRMLEAGDRL